MLIILRFNKDFSWTVDHLPHLQIVDFDSLEPNA